jgi:two-component system, NarL family, nitrate/nitrite sensor histidine kinase NarX
VEKRNSAPEERTIYQWLPAASAGIVMVVVLFYFSVETMLIRNLDAVWQAAYGGSFLLLAVASIYWATKHLNRLQTKKLELEQRTQEAERLISEAYQRLSAMFRIRQQFYEADNEKEIVELLLKTSVQLSGAAGASFVPLDEHRQPLSVVNYGKPSLPLPEAWLEYLASPFIRESCSTCDKSNHFVVTCPLLKGPFAEAAGIFCVPLRRGEREFGVLNLYVPDKNRLDVETRAFLNSLVNETSQALEGVWLRNRELISLQQLQAVREKADLFSLLSDLLDNLRQTLEPDFALLVLKNGDGIEEDKTLIREELVKGKLPSQAKHFIDATIQNVFTHGKPTNFSSTGGNKTSPVGLRALVAVPLSAVDRTTIGVLIVGNKRAQGFHQRQFALLQTVAGQIALVVQNAHQLSDLEYKAMIDERTRLAREIHDGLAQTLGFLKLQVAQMQKYLERGDIDRLKNAVQLYYQTLSETYQDARFAIDGLRIVPSGHNLDTWLQQMLNEFQENVGPQTLNVTLKCFEVDTELPSEVQAQVIRIMQEALSNVRKHSRADNVWVSCIERDGEMVIEIQDDGKGFAAEDVAGTSRHGLRGMRERAELIRAEFQVISRPKEGTTVRISIPVKLGEVIL